MNANPFRRGAVLSSEAGNGPDAKGEQDWAHTLHSLLHQATEANRAFEYDRAIEYLRTIQHIWDAKGLPEFSLDLRFELHLEMGKALASLGRHDEALLAYQEVLKYCREATHLPVRAETFMHIGQLLAKQGDFERALGFLQRAIGAGRRLDDPTLLCKALRNLGVVYVELGEFEEAQLTYDEAIAVARSHKDGLVLADLQNNLGTIMNMRGHWRRALELYRDALQIYRAEGEIRKCAYCENNIGITFTEQGLNEDAAEFFERAYDTAAEIKDASLTLLLNINLADLFLKMGDMDKAQQHCEEAELHLSTEGTVNGRLVETRKIRAMIAAARGDVEQARAAYTEAHKLARQIGARFLEAEVLLERGKLLGVCGCNLDALTDLEASYSIYRSLKAEGKRGETESVIHSIEYLYLRTFESMAVDVERKDEYTKGHSDRVASFSLLLGRRLGLHAADLKTIVAAALLHDIGKIKIDDRVLKKAGRLTDEEFSQIKRHPELGVELLRGKEFPWDVKPSILAHHERINGSGYPLGLKGDDIPLGARIICIADVFDALTSDRVYRRAYDAARAVEIMEAESGTTFDPMILNLFVDMVRQGDLDFIINPGTDQDEMYSIWSRCMDGQQKPYAATTSPSVLEGATLR